MEMKKVVLILVIVMLGSLMMAAFLGASFLPFGSVVSPHMVTVDETRNFSIEEIQEISVETISTDIKIIPANSTEIVVHLYGEVTQGILEEEFARESGSRLAISVRPLPGINIYTRINLSLDIYVPADQLDSLRIDTVSGDTNITELNVDDFSFKAVSGSLRAKSLFAENMGLQTVSGKIDLANASGNLTTKTVSGDVSVTFEHFENDVTVNTTSGDTKLTLPEDAQFEVRLDTVSGKINSEFPITMNSLNQRNVEGKVGDGSNKIQIKSVSGGVRLEVLN